MNFDNAVVAHASWKRKLKAYLEKPDGSLKAEEIEVDNRCDLGKWIAGEGRQHSALPEFNTLVSAHRRFHRAAGDLVRKANSGVKVNEELALGTQSEFSDATNLVVLTLGAIKNKV